MNAQNQINALFGIVSQQLRIPPLSTSTTTKVTSNGDDATNQVNATLHIVQNGYKKR